MKNIVRKIHQLDATDQTVGRLGTKIANLLHGKNKPEFERHVDLGDVVEVKNIKYLRFTGKKLAQKTYKHYSGYLGGLKTKKMSEMMQQNPAKILERAVKEMLPNNRLRPKMMKRLIIK
jgi:large subunit ribosomal protein L13